MLFFCFEQNLQQSFSALNFGREATQKQHTAPFKKKKIFGFLLKKVSQWI